MDNDRLMALVLGVILLLFGLVAVGAPAAVFNFIVLIIGIILIISGILTAGLGLSAPAGTVRMLLLGSGLVSIILGLLAVISPYFATIAIGYIIALWLVINGVLTIAYAASIEWEKHRILTGVCGLISLLAGLFIFISPESGMDLIMMVFGIFCLISGIITVIMGAFFWRS